MCFSICVVKIILQRQLELLYYVEHRARCIKVTRKGENVMEEKCWQTVWEPLMVERVQRGVWPRLWIALNVSVEFSQILKGVYFIRSRSAVCPQGFCSSYLHKPWSVGTSLLLAKARLSSWRSTMLSFQSLYPIKTILTITSEHSLLFLFLNNQQQFIYILCLIAHLQRDTQNCNMLNNN